MSELNPETEFLWNVHGTLEDNIRFADAKAIAAMTLVAALTIANLVLLGNRIKDIPPYADLWKALHWAVPVFAAVYVLTAMGTLFCALAVLMPRKYVLQAQGTGASPIKNSGSSPKRVGDSGPFSDRRQRAGEDLEP